MNRSQNLKLKQILETLNLQEIAFIEFGATPQDLTLECGKDLVKLMGRDFKYISQDFNQIKIKFTKNNHSKIIRIYE